MGGAAIVCYLLALRDGRARRAVKQARAIAFSLLALSPLLHAFNCRSATSSIARAAAASCSMAARRRLVMSAAIHLVAVLVPSLRPVFRPTR